MNPDKIFEDILTGAQAAAAALAPAALGSGIAVAMKHGLSWTERFVQFAVGIVVSWYATRAAAFLFGLDPFLAQGGGFTIGLLAYDALPRVRERLLAMAIDALDAVRDRFIKRGKE